MDFATDSEDEFKKLLAMFHNKQEDIVSERKQATLNGILKDGSFKMLNKNYEEAILLYEKALDLISYDPFLHDYNLTELDLCTISYSLDKCYSADEKLFHKAIEDLLPLVVSNGKQFPFLYYGLANLCLKEHSYQQAESIINNGLEVVTNMKDGSAFETNWPGTDIQMPESDPGCLVKLLQLLKQQCVEMQCPNSKSDIKTEDDSSDDVCYQSDVSYEQEETEDNTPLIFEEKSSTKSMHFTSKPLSCANATSSEDLPTTDIDDISVQNLNELNDSHSTNKSGSLTEIDLMSDDDVVMRDLQNTEKDADAVLSVSDNDTDGSKSASVKKIRKWKVDVPEFVPRGLNNNLSSGAETKTVPLNENSSKSSLDSCITAVSKEEAQNACPIIAKTPESFQSKSSTADVVTQTPDVKQEEITPKDESAKKEMEVLRDLLQTLSIQGREQLEEINALQSQLLSKREELHQSERNKILSEQLVSIKLVKMEMQDKQFKKTFLETKLKSEEQEKKITLLQALLTEHYSQCYEHHKQLILNHVKRCRAMISDLHEVLKYLSATTTPTLEECQKQIRCWEQELKMTNEQAALYHESCQQVFSNLRNGIYIPFPEPVVLPTQGFNLRDVLHESYTIVANHMVRDQQYYQQQNQQYQQQYATWYNNYGRYQPGYQPPGPVVAAAPYYYNHPQGQAIYAQPVRTPPVPYKNKNQGTLAIACHPPISSVGVGHRLNVQESIVPQSNTNKSHLFKAPENKMTYAARKPETDRNTETEGDESKSSSSDSNSSCYAGIKIQEVIPENQEDTSSYQSGPSTHVVDKVNSNTNRKLVNNHLQKGLKTEASTGNTSCSNNYFELKASKNAADVLLESVEKVLTKTINSSSKNLESETDQVSCKNLEQSIAAYSSSNTLEPKLNQATGASLELKAGQITDNALRRSAKTADNNWWVPADLTRQQAETDKLDNLEEYTEPKPANLSKQPKAHNKQDNIKDQLSATKSSNKNPQPGPSNTRDYAPDYHSNQKTESSEKKPDDAPTDIKPLGGPKFNSLFTFIRNKIPERTDDELLLAIKTVRERKSKLSGMSRQSIVAAVRKELDRANAELTTCVICIETFGDSPISTLQCQHSFHVQCIQQWFDSNTICPVCRVHAMEDLPPVEI